MEKCVATCQEDPSEFFIIIGHHGRARSFLGHGEEVVDILNRAKRFLPQLQLDRGVKLGEPSIEMVLKSIWIGKIDGMRLVGVFRDIGEMQTESLAESTELDLADMF